MKLSARIALASVTLVTAVLVSMGSLLIFFEKRHLVEAQFQHQTELVQRLAQVCAESAAEQNDLILLNYVLSFSKDPGILGVSFLRPDGQVVVDSHVEMVGKVMEDPATRKLLSASDMIRQESRSEKGSPVADLGMPVASQGRTIGFARILYNQDHFRRQVQESLDATLRRLLYVTAIVIGMGIIGSILLARTVTKHISQLSEATKIVGKGELAYRISIPRRDEIGQLARSFNEMTQKLQELDELKNDFVSSVSHELRSPLTALKGFLQMFQMGITGALNDRQKENVELMLQCTDRLNRFVNDILDVAKLEAGMFEFDLKPVDAKALAAETVALFQPQAQADQVTLLVNIPGDAPAVVADSDRLRQVLTNLISNALKFTPQGGRITVWLKDEGPHVKMGVTDTGAGIPEQAIPRLFNKFEQVKETKEKAKRKGTGLGLTISKKIVEAFHGTIGVESQLNKGTTFYFTLPKASAAKAA